MNGSIFLIQDGKLVEMKEEAYDSEDLLQRLLAQYPDLLAGSQIDKASPRRWLLVTREMGVPDSEGGAGRWSLDHLFLDQDAVPTLVEVKRSSDTRLRREVVGQMLDYAANAVTYWPVQKIQDKLAEQFESESVYEETLSRFLEGCDETQFWERLELNLRAGKVRMLFVADVIPPELQRVVEFLNEQMNPAEVLAVQVKQFAGQNLKTLVPTVIGQTAQAQGTKAVKTRSTKQWDRESFLGAMMALDDKRGIDLRDIAEKFLSWGESQDLSPRWGAGLKCATVSMLLSYSNRDYKIYSVSSEAGGKLWLLFDEYLKQAPFDAKPMRREFLNRVNSLDGITVSTDKTHSSIDLMLFQDESRFLSLVEQFKWYIDQVKKIVSVQSQK